jgi:hypothetical protein
LKLRAAATWDELHQLEGFEKEQLPVNVMLTGAVVGQYEMPPTLDMRPCGIVNCSRAHRHGFIIELAGGRLSNVGRDCGRIKFGARWNQMLKRFRTARKAQASRKAAEHVRAQARDVLAAAQSTPAELVAARERLQAFDALPNHLRQELSRRAQAGEARIVRWREPTRDEIDRAKFRHEPIPTRTEQLVGTFAAIKAVAPNSRADMIADVRLPQRLRELTEMIDDPKTDSDVISNKIRSVNETRDLLQVAIGRTAEFFVPENLALMRLVDPRGQIQRVVINLGPPFRIEI